jgi:hypothetical protein
MPVVDPEAGGKLVGMISLEDLLSGRARTLTEERTRERVLRIRLPNSRTPALAAEVPVAAGIASDRSGPRFGPTRE